MSSLKLSAARHDAVPDAVPNEQHRTGQKEWEERNSLTEAAGNVTIHLPDGH